MRELRGLVPVSRRCIASICRGHRETLCRVNMDRGRPEICAAAGLPHCRTIPENAIRRDAGQVPSRPFWVPQ